MLVNRLVAFHHDRCIGRRSSNARALENVQGALWCVGSDADFERTVSCTDAHVIMSMSNAANGTVFRYLQSKNSLRC